LASEEDEMTNLIAGAVALFTWWANAPPALADDGELKAILGRQSCVPGRIGRTELSQTIIAFDVTCRESSRALTVVCVGASCRLQSTHGRAGFRTLIPNGRSTAI
jgi:hypothetical protein